VFLIPPTLARGDGCPQSDSVRVVHDRAFDSVLWQGAQNLDKTILDGVFQIDVSAPKNATAHAAHGRRDGFQESAHRRRIKRPRFERQLGQVRAAASD
jgi:hypothetical protein